MRLAGIRTLNAYQHRVHLHHSYLVLATAQVSLQSLFNLPTTWRLRLKSSVRINGHRTHATPAIADFTSLGRPKSPSHHLRAHRSDILNDIPDLINAILDFSHHRLRFLDGQENAELAVLAVEDRITSTHRRLVASAEYAKSCI